MVTPKHAPGPPMTLGNMRELGLQHLIGARQFPRATDLFVPRPKPRPYWVVRACFVRLRPQPTFDRRAQAGRPSMAIPATTE
jgi:hypothetical protein